MKKIIFHLTMLTAMTFAGCKITDEIVDATYAVAVTASAGGTAQADKDKAAEGATVALTATPTGDYAFKQWTVVKGGVTLSPNAATSPAKFTMPAGEVEIKATFEAVSRTVTITTNGNGTATANPANAAAGTEVTLTATPTGDYAFKQWTVVSGGVTLSPNAATSPATFTMPAQAVEIRAVFYRAPDPRFLGKWEPANGLNTLTVGRDELVYVRNGNGKGFTVEDIVWEKAVGRDDMSILYGRLTAFSMDFPLMLRREEGYGDTCTLNDRVQIHLTIYPNGNIQLNSGTIDANDLHPVTP